MCNLDNLNPTGLKEGKILLNVFLFYYLLRSVCVCVCVCTSVRLLIRNRPVICKPCLEFHLTVMCGGCSCKGTYLAICNHYVMWKC